MLKKKIYTLIQTVTSIRASTTQTKMKKMSKNKFKFPMSQTTKIALQNCGAA